MQTNWQCARIYIVDNEIVSLETSDGDYNNRPQMTFDGKEADHCLVRWVEVESGRHVDAGAILASVAWVPEVGRLQWAPERDGRVMTVQKERP